jgi:hypothetical protein
MQIDLKKLYLLDTWILFMISFLPYVFQNSEIGEMIGLISFSLVLFFIFQLSRDLVQLLPADHSLTFTKFLWRFGFAAVYLFVISTTIGGYQINGSTYDSYGAAAPVLILLHLLLFYCLLYCFYFCAKVLAIVIYKKDDPDYSHWLGTFFALWFLPIGIWFLKPKISQVFGKNSLKD